MTSTAPTRLWTVQDVADFACVSRRTVENWRARGGGPRALKISNRLRYDPDDVRAWAAAQADDDPQGAS